jgi:hypothetical protein
MNSKDLFQAFLNRENIAGVAYRHNDYVLEPRQKSIF